MPALCSAAKRLVELLEDSLERHASLPIVARQPALQDFGLYRFRHRAEQHASSPELVRRMHRYLKSPTGETTRPSRAAREREPVAIRDLLEVVPGKPVPLEEVEDASPILEPFQHPSDVAGRDQPEAHRTLAIAMNRLGARSNTGEGGEDPELYRQRAEANNRVKQVASGAIWRDRRISGPRRRARNQDGAGLQTRRRRPTPAAKVTAYIARLRHAVPGMSLISPPPHHDIYSIEDLAQLIYDLRAMNPRARIGVKLVSGAGVGIIAAGVAKAGPT